MFKHFCILFALTFGLQIRSKNLIAAADSTPAAELAALDTQKIMGDISLGRFSEINRLSRIQLDETYEKEHAHRIRLLTCKKCLQVFIDASAAVNTADKAGEETLQQLATELSSLFLVCCSYINNGGKPEDIVDSVGHKINFDTLRSNLLSKIDKNSAEYTNFSFRIPSLQRTWLLMTDKKDEPIEVTGCWEHGAEA